MQQVPQSMELLCEEATPDEGYLRLETDAGLRNRMRENCTYGSARAVGKLFHFHDLRKEC